MRHLFKRLKRPFQIRVLVFEHTKIEVRSFPPLFRHQWVKTVQERIDETVEGGGVVQLEAAEFHLYEPLRLADDDCVKGVGLTNTILAFHPRAEELANGT